MSKLFPSPYRTWVNTLGTVALLLFSAHLVVLAQNWSIETEPGFHIGENEEIPIRTRCPMVVIEGEAVLEERFGLFSQNEALKSHGEELMAQLESHCTVIIKNDDVVISTFPGPDCPPNARCLKGI